MMRVLSLALVFSLASLVSAGEGGAEDQSREKSKPPKSPEERRAMMERTIANLKKQRENAPKTLTEAHERLEEMLPAEELAKIDAMPSERAVSVYRFGLGLNMRSAWGLWRDSPLAKHMKDLGFTHPDIISTVILETFWCKRHGKDLRLPARASLYKRVPKRAAHKAREERDDRVRKAIAAIRSMMMGLRFEKRDVPTVPVPVRFGPSVRFLCPFRGGVFLTVYHQGRRQNDVAITEGYSIGPADGEARPTPEYDDFVLRVSNTTGPGDDFYTVGHYFDPSDGKIHQVRLEEVDDVYAAVVAGDRAWFAGVTNGKVVLVGVNDHDRVTVPLPQEDGILDLGLDGQSLLAVYRKTIYRLADRKWTLLHSADILLPRSGPPPQRHGDMVFFRDEGYYERDKRLWWLTMGERLHLSVLDRDVGVVGPHGPPGWPHSSAYCITSSGDLWACVGDGTALLRRSQDGSYSIAIMNESVRFTGELRGFRERGQGLSVSAVTALPDDSLVLAGETGLYRLQRNALVQELGFTLDKPLVLVKERDRVVSHVTWRRQGGKMVKEVTDVVQTPSETSRKVVRSVTWNPNNVLLLDDGSYFISTGSRRGVYGLRQGDDGQWRCRFVERGDPVVW